MEIADSVLWAVGGLIVLCVLIASVGIIMLDETGDICDVEADEK